MYNVVWTTGARRLGPFASALLLAALTSASVAGDTKKNTPKTTLEEALCQQAPKIRDFLWKKDMRQQQLFGRDLPPREIEMLEPPAPELSPYALVSLLPLAAAGQLCLRT